MTELYTRTITHQATLIDALKKMDTIDKKLLLILDEDQKFKGLISIGDIQRAVIRNLPLNTLIRDVLRSNIKVGKPSDSDQVLKEMMIEYRMEFCPVVDDEENITKVIFWEDIIEKTAKVHFKKFNLPVVVMAGGLGTRLKPITNVLPKPLIPLGDKTILEEIFERFNKYGCNDFHISINYKADLIQYYIQNQKLSVSTHFFIEDKPLGTAGSLSLLKGIIKSTFFVSNCDVLIDQDYSEILHYHQESKNEITLVAAFKHFEIPYGIVETGVNGSLLNIQEKPSYDYLVNAGMYILEPHLLEEIPIDKFYHITSLIEELRAQGRKVGVFPVSAGSWLDIGKWDEYNKTSKKLGLQEIEI